MTILDTLNSIEPTTDYYRAKLASLRRAKPLIRLWMNNPTGNGLISVGRVDFDDTIKGSFPFKNNTPTEGQLTLRDDHYISIFLKQLPNNPDLKKNIVITVDFYGGQKRWSGLLDKWNVKTSKDGTKVLECTFEDDLTFLQYLLCPPNPLLPIDVFQFPRIFALAGPSKWCISMLILINLIRVEGNLWNLPDDPFSLQSWADSFDWSQWQCHIKADPFLLDDSSLWTFLASRMNPVDSVIADALDDAQLTIEYRRILTDDGEQSGMALVPNVQNGCLRFEVVDNSNATSVAGTFFEGTIVDGFIRSVTTYVGGFVEDTLSQVTDDETLHPDEYYQSGFLGTVAIQPWLVVRDNEWTAIESSDMSWGPSKNVSVVVGGDNPAADAIAKMILETVGNAISYVLLLGFSSGGTILADLIMPFLAGTIAAWVYWKNTGRATELGWAHYLESYQQGAENNSWSLSALSALRGGFLVGKSETVHIMALHESWILPGLHIDIGQRMGSTIQSKGLENVVFVNQLEELIPAWDNTTGSETGFGWQMKAGKSERVKSLGERLARLTRLISDSAANVGLSFIQG